MKKIKLNLNNLTVDSFETDAVQSERGTVMGNEPPTEHGQKCGSAFDACNTGLCTGDCGETYAPAACPTYYPEYC